MNKKSIVNTYFYILLLSIFQATRFFGEGFEKPIFIISNILFTIFVITKIYSLRNEKRWLLNPLFLASLRMFLLAYGATIFYIYFEGKSLHDYFKVYNPYEYLNNGIIYASIGFLSMWYSYQGRTTKKIAHSLFNLLTRKKIIRKELEPRWIIVYAIFFASIIFKLILISLGVYGVIGTILANDIQLPYLQYVLTLSSAGSGALLFLNLYYFKTNKKKILFISFFIIDLFFSIITGFKGAIMMSILVIGISYYLINLKIKKSHLFIAVLSIGFAYSIISPYREYINIESSFDRYSIKGISGAFIKSINNTNRNEKGTDKLELIKRFNFSTEFTKFQEYKTKHGLKKDDPDFISISLSTPIQIVTPRFLWKDKPRSDLGVWWVTQKILGMSNVNSSSAFGPLGFLYLTGGAFAIMVGFFIIGLFLQILSLFLSSEYWGAIIIALVLMFNTTGLEAGFNFYIIGFIHTLILAIIFQYIILKKTY